MRDILAPLGVTSDADGLNSARSDKREKRAKGLEPSTFSLEGCGPEFEGTATSTVTDDAATTMRSACPEPCPDEGNMDQTADLVRVLS
ncbi:MAG: hypothetical protein QF412_15785, partial [Planctomycetota bacterium]|nr:hypothetical protein [Planctomycetota bacterium]